MKGIENIYLSALSLKDRIENESLEDGMTEAGRINGLEYRYTVSRLAAKKNEVSADRRRSGNAEDFSLQLLRVELQLAGRTYDFITSQKL